MSRNRSYEPKDIATEKFGRNQKFAICQECGEKLDQYGCACVYDDSEQIRKAERRNEEALSGGYWSPFDSLLEY